VVASSVYALLQQPPGRQWALILGLTLLTGSFSVKVPSINARISVSETFVFVAVLLFGPSAGTITVLFEALVVILWMTPAGRPLHRLVFNLSAPAVAIWIAAHAFYLFPGIERYSIRATPLSQLLPPLTGFTALYFLLNSWLVAVVVGIERQESPLRIWWTKFTWLSVNYFSGASVAALIVTFMRELDPTALLIIVPLILVSYLTFRIAMGRVEDSNRHLSELNRLYLSTIETLAMAIDAKDQITHGHIRRVQGYAVGLAKAVGVTDDTLIKAIEAAALLHDMGKLAVPEYILNKPGKLSAAEFDKMKLHASVGADILTAIDFPFPVVPIVRHHHENWDGTGYPSGLKGVDIPIGARILSVVDCFDALTSDRPYRPRLSSNEALRILNERSGAMYDPLIVDTFARVHSDLDRSISSQPPTALDEIAGSTRTLTVDSVSPSFADIAASSDEAYILYELACALGDQPDVSSAAEQVSSHLKRLIPFAMSVVYRYDDSTDVLEPVHSTGDPAALTNTLKIPIGARLSGWVGANRQTIVNSDPTLDFGEAARNLTPRLQSALSTPLISDGALIGVITLYANQRDWFTDSHRRTIEIVAQRVAPALRHAASRGSSYQRNQGFVLPTMVDLEQLLQKRSNVVNANFEWSLLFVDFVVREPLSDPQHTQLCHQAVDRLRQCIAKTLEKDALTFRCAINQFVVLVSNRQASQVLTLAKQLQDELSEQVASDPQVGGLRPEILISCVTAPRDLDSIRRLIGAHARTGSPRPEVSRIH
jgi:putative nucleotidyltransferase with HDIG domain